MLNEGDMDRKRRIFHVLRTNLDLDQKPRQSVLVVQVRGGLNDSELPGLKMDKEKLEISVNWKQLLTSFFVQKKAADELESSVSIGW